jgi:hypothetical protein
VWRVPITLSPFEPLERGPGKGRRNVSYSSKRNHRGQS